MVTHFLCSSRTAPSKSIKMAIYFTQKKTASARKSPAGYLCYHRSVVCMSQRKLHHTLRVAGIYFFALYFFDLTLFPVVVPLHTHTRVQHRVHPGTHKTYAWARDPILNPTQTHARRTCTILEAWPMTAYATLQKGGCCRKMKRFGLLSTSPLITFIIIAATITQPSIARFYILFIRFFPAGQHAHVTKKHTHEVKRWQVRSGCKERSKFHDWLNFDSLLRYPEVWF